MRLSKAYLRFTDSGAGKVDRAAVQKYCDSGLIRKISNSHFQEKQLRDSLREERKRERGRETRLEVSVCVKMVETVPK